MESKKYRFVLVHGAGHGAWCWFKLAALLESAGHAFTTVDLAGCGISPKQVQEVQSLGEYVWPLMEVMASLPPGEKVILVGHSNGGFALSLAMEAYPEKVSAAVFAAAFMPPPGSSLLDQFPEYVPTDPAVYNFMDSKFSFGRGPDNPPTSVLLGPKHLAANLYQNCPLEDLKLAITLIRDANIFSSEQVEDTMLREERYGSVARAFLVSKEDKLFTEDQWRPMYEKASANELREIEGADHMVMISKPQELCNYLLEFAEKYT